MIVDIMEVQVLSTAPIMLDKHLKLCIIDTYAVVAKLADALASGASDS